MLRRHLQLDSQYSIVDVAQERLAVETKDQCQVSCRLLSMAARAAEHQQRAIAVPLTWNEQCGAVRPRMSALASRPHVHGSR